MTEKDVPDEFQKVTKDFYKDVLTTFPEYKEKLGPNEINFLQGNDDGLILFSYCKKVYPERFFDILYKNTDMFSNDEINTKFLPNIEFKKIWKEDISEATRNVIWKYLQLVLFSVSTGLDSGESFGETAKLFEAIDENELKQKLEETMGQMGDMFDPEKVFEGLSGETFEPFDMSGINMEDMPDAEQMQEHINSLLGGKLGTLAHEIAEETASELQVDMEDATNVSDVFQKLFKNPGKLMNMVKKVGSKLDSKLKSGEIKESELMQEASELMEKMKNMPGMKNMDKLLGQMGLPTGGKNSKVNMGAFQSHMKANIGKAKTRERMLRKLEERKKQRELEQQQQAQYTTSAWSSNTDNTVQKSSRDAGPVKKKKKKKKKNRKKKN
jgi:hypothetical protein